VAFLDVGPRGAKDGLLVDPWETPLNIVLGTNELSALLGESLPRDCNFAIWSNGPNHKNEDGSGDDVASWKIHR
jgi:hypothetical protein